MLVWFFSTNISQTFLILRRLQYDIIISLHVKYPLFLSGFNETLIFLADFQKIIKCQIS
jgi:hypothetical protein